MYAYPATPWSPPYNGRDNSKYHICENCAQIYRCCFRLMLFSFLLYSVVDCFDPARPKSLPNPACLLEGLSSPLPVGQGPGQAKVSPAVETEFPTFSPHHRLTQLGAETTSHHYHCWEGFHTTAKYTHRKTHRYSETAINRCALIHSTHEHAHPHTHTCKHTHTLTLEVWWYPDVHTVIPFLYHTVVLGGDAQNHLDRRDLEPGGD